MAIARGEFVLLDQAGAELERRKATVSKSFNAPRELRVQPGAGGFVAYLASSDEVVRFHDLAKGKTTNLKGHTSPPSALAFDAKGVRLATLSSGTVIVWDVAKKKPFSSRRFVTSVADFFAEREW